MHRPLSALVLSILRLFVCYVPIAYAGSALFGLVGLFWGCVVANFVTAGLSYFWFHREVNQQQALFEQTNTKIEMAQKAANE
jgi:Na+-driven multidrug efflux pump